MEASPAIIDIEGDIGLTSIIRIPVAVLETSLAPIELACPRSADGVPVREEALLVALAAVIGVEEKIGFATVGGSEVTVPEVGGAGGCAALPVHARVSPVGGGANYTAGAAVGDVGLKVGTETARAGVGSWRGASWGCG